MNFTYVISCPRSGSTMMQRLLCSNSKYGTLPETWFILSENVFEASDSGVLEFGFEATKGAYNAFLNNLKINHSEVFRKRIEIYRSLLIENLDNEISSFIEKTPRNILLINQLYESLGEGDKIIILRRKSKDVLSSYLEYFDKFPFLKSYKFFREINHYQELLDLFQTRQNEIRFKEKVMVVNYDEIINNTNSVVVKLDSFFNERFDPNKLSNLSKNHSGKFYGDKKNIESKAILKTKKKRNYWIILISSFYYDQGANWFQKILLLPIIVVSILVYYCNPRLISKLFNSNPKRFLH